MARGPCYNLRIAWATNLCANATHNREHAQCANGTTSHHTIAPYQHWTSTSSQQPAVPLHTTIHLKPHHTCPYLQRLTLSPPPPPAASCAAHQSPPPGAPPAAWHHAHRHKERAAAATAGRAPLLGLSVYKLVQQPLQLRLLALGKVARDAPPLRARVAGGREPPNRREVAGGAHGAAQHRSHQPRPRALRDRGSRRCALSGCKPRSTCR
jgi:hypothetical protein